MPLTAAAIVAGKASTAQVVAASQQAARPVSTMAAIAVAAARGHTRSTPTRPRPASAQAALASRAVTPLERLLVDR